MGGGPHNSLGWLGKASLSGGEMYHYGYPTYGSVEPNVVAQWLFDEASGDIVDEVSGITLADVGTPTYSVAATGSWANLSPGITIGSNIDFYKSTATASLNIGATDSVVFEAVASTTASDPKYLFCMGPTFTSYNGLGIRFYTVGGTFLAPFFKSDDNVLCSANFDISGKPYNDGSPHKYRVVFNRSGNMQAFFDGVSLGTQSMATVAGKVITCGFIRTGAYVTGYGWVGTIYEERLTIGNATNNSGGPGGG